MQCEGGVAHQGKVWLRSAGCSVALEVWYSSVECRVGKYNAAQLSGIQRSSEGAMLLRGCNVAQKSYAARLRCVKAQYGAVQHIAQQYAGSSEGCKVAHQGATISLAGQGSILISPRHPIQVFFAERTTGHVMCPPIVLSH